MPIYEYRCRKCGDFEETQRITDEPLRQCPNCRCKVRRLISSTSFQLKGSGWYVTDYARSGKGKDESGKDGASKDGAGKDGASKGEAAKTGSAESSSKSESKDSKSPTSPKPKPSKSAGSSAASSAES